MNNWISVRTQLSLAEDIARFAHNGQVDKQGYPYILHVQRVVENLTKMPYFIERPTSLQYAQTIAWLHDVIEDTEFVMSDLTEYDVFDRQTLFAVSALTRQKERGTYDDYISHIIGHGDPLVILVKLADLEDHLSETNPLRPAGCPPSLRPRYVHAQRRLLDAMQFYR